MNKYELPKKLLKGKEEKQVVCYRLKQSTIENIEKIAENNNLTKTEVINIAIENLIQ